MRNDARQAAYSAGRSQAHRPDGVRYIVPGDYVRHLPDDDTIELLGRGRSVINTGEKIYPPR